MYYNTMIFKVLKTTKGHFIIKCLNKPRYFLIVSLKLNPDTSII